MVKHLTLVKNQQATPATTADEFSDMEIILAQALLMETGSATFKTFKSSESVDILSGLVSLAYTALQLFAMRDQATIENKGEGYQIYQKLAIIQLLSEKIHQCSSGQAARYAELYYASANLASGYLNADFDKAFRAYHDWRKHYLDHNNGLTISNAPELADCLYE